MPVSSTTASSRRASERSTPRSASMRWAMPGRCTLMTTSSPSSVTARCTCAMDAAASGSGSTCANSSSTSLPSASRICAWTSASGMASTWSWSVASSSTNSAGSRSARVESTCPSLMKVGPSSDKKRRKRRAVDSRRASSETSTFSLRPPSMRHTPARSATSPKPWRAAMRVICRMRLRSWRFMTERTPPAGADGPRSAIARSPPRRRAASPSGCPASPPPAGTAVRRRPARPRRGPP